MASQLIVGVLHRLCGSCDCGRGVVGDVPLFAESLHSYLFTCEVTALGVLNLVLWFLVRNFFSDLDVQVRLYDR